MFRTKKKELRHEFPECQLKSCPSFTTVSTQSTFCVIAILVSNEQERESSKNLVTLSSSTHPSLSAQPSLVLETRLFDGRHRLMPAYHLKILQCDIRDIFYFFVSLTFFSFHVSAVSRKIFLKCQAMDYIYLLQHHSFKNKKCCEMFGNKTMMLYIA